MFNGEIFCTHPDTVHVCCSMYSDFIMDHDECDILLTSCRHFILWVHLINVCIQRDRGKLSG